jgi:hypothetical protein
MLVKRESKNRLVLNLKEPTWKRLRKLNEFYMKGCKEGQNTMEKKDMKPLKNFPILTRLNNNLFSRPSQHTKLVYEIPLFVGQGTPFRLAI